MHVQGYTRERCRALWEREFPRHIAELEVMSEKHGIDLSEDIASQKGLSFQQWFEREKTLYAGGLSLRSRGREFEFTDILAGLAMKIEYCEPDVIWTDLYDYCDDLDTNLTFHQNFRRFGKFDYLDQDFIEPTSNVLILTEGKSDTRVLSTAIPKLYPEYSDLYQFVDFAEFNVSGGASMLTKIVKAFAGIRMEQPILALFDNDAAGLFEKHHLDNLGTLPKNFKILALPDIDLARNYPTIGPEGKRHMDVNGAASSIELFLGKEALTDRDGTLHPIRWTGWNRQIARYQGSLDYKDTVTTRFMDRIKMGGDPITLRKELPELDQLLNCIFCAFH